MSNTSSSTSYNWGIQNTYVLPNAYGVAASTAVPNWGMMSGAAAPKAYAMEEEFVLIDWARRRGEEFATEISYRIGLWTQMSQMKQMTQGPYLPSPTWTTTWTSTQPVTYTWTHVPGYTPGVTTASSTASFYEDP